MSWKDIGDPEIAAGQPITAELMAKFLNRDNAAMGHYCGGKWREIACNATTTPDKTFAQIFIPRGARYLFVECESGVNTHLPAAAWIGKLQLGLDDGDSGCVSDFTTLENPASMGDSLIYPKRVAFSPITLSAISRGQIVSIYFHIHPDDITYAHIYYMGNDPTRATAGYGIRFE